MEKSFRVLPHMCRQQKHDIKNLLEAADEIGAAATSVIAQGGMGYNLLLEARDKFKKMLLECSAHYRLFEEEDEEDSLVTH